MNLRLPIRHLLVFATLSVVSVTVATAQSAARLTLTQITVKDYANLTIPQCLKKLEAACNKTEADIGNVQIVLDGKISYRGKVRGLYDELPKEPVQAQLLIMQIASKASLAMKLDSDRVVLRARSEAEEEQAKAQKEMGELLDGVMLESLHLIDTKPKAALAYLERAYAKRNPDKKPVKFRLSGDEPPGTFSLDLHEVPMSEAVRYVAGLIDLEFRVRKEKRTIWFKHRATK